MRVVARGLHGALVGADDGGDDGQSEAGSVARSLERDPAHRLVNLRAIRKGALLVQLGVGAQ